MPTLETQGPSAIRDAAPADEHGWRGLWAAYNQFYGSVVPGEVTDATWRRILDPRSAIFARVAERDGALLGFSVSVLHEGTWTTSPICYLEDLFVAPQTRGGGIGRALVQDLVDLARMRGWSRLYWHTEADNLVARRLYDGFVSADDFVRYRLLLGL